MASSGPASSVGLDLRSEDTVASQPFKSEPKASDASEELRKGEVHGLRGFRGYSVLQL